MLSNELECDDVGTERDDGCDDVDERIVFTAVKKQNKATFLNAKLTKLEAAIRNFVDAQAPSPELARKRSTAHTLLTNVCNAHISSYYNNGETVFVSLFGSTAYHTDILTSDLDFSIHLANAPTNILDVSHLLETLIEPLHEGGRRAFQFTEARLRQRCPVLCFKLYDLECDLSIAANPESERAKTKLITTFVEFDHRFRPLLIVIKQWAKERGLNDASKGYLNSFGWMLVLVQFLQVLEILPVVQPPACSTATNAAFLAMPSDLRYRVLTPDEINSSSRNNQATVSELVEGFFEWLGDQDLANVCISVRRGTPVPVGQYLVPPQSGGFSSPYPPHLCIEDPFDPHDNVARGVKRAAVRAIMAAVASAQDALRRHSEEDDPLKSLFAPGTLIAPNLPQPNDRRCQPCRFGYSCSKSSCTMTHPGQSCLHGVHGGGTNCPWHKWWQSQAT